jgi:hypothetical protein
LIDSFIFFAGVVVLHAFIQICNSLIDGTAWGFKEWSSLIIAVLVTSFMIIYRWISDNNDNDDSDDGSPKGKRANLNVYKFYNNFDFSNQQANSIKQSQR